MALFNFETFLKSLEVHTVIDASIPTTQYIPIDLSNQNPELQKVDFSSSEDLEKFIWDYMNQNDAKAAYGGYLEQRGIYRRSLYFNQENLDTERNIHLGLDIWIDEHAPIFAPLEGKIHSFENNTNHGDYGPTIILKHDINGLLFYTLYGHLSLSSIENLKVGAKVRQGQQFANLGSAKVNGDYPPHLHFQIIREIGNFEGDYPGVTSRQDLDYYKNNCPDPNLLLKLY
ncbi:peptidoglycan DD-metalloendopeptidase family protein [Winogradskyella ursingii]|uniref:peptidoglycan DD-metalloendopeptidase family protein n=1 Tax=Winogradskyella ursingii TaxID=2686079 RepID=UPI0015CA3622|nr:peptidoglycan DD-metalloendopeptidase family protein [Winogradskyella ursingii]